MCEENRVFFGNFRRHIYSLNRPNPLFSRYPLTIAKTLQLKYSLKSSSFHKIIPPIYYPHYEEHIPTIFLHIPSPIYKSPISNYSSKQSRSKRTSGKGSSSKMYSVMEVCKRTKRTILNASNLRHYELYQVEGNEYLTLHEINQKPSDEKRALLERLRIANNCARAMIEIDDHKEDEEDIWEQRGQREINIESSRVGLGNPDYRGQTELPRHLKEVSTKNIHDTQLTILQCVEQRMEQFDMETRNEFAKLGRKLHRGHQCLSCLEAHMGVQVPRELLVTILQRMEQFDMETRHEFAKLGRKLDRELQRLSCLEAHMGVQIPRELLVSDDEDQVEEHGGTQDVEGGTSSGLDKGKGPLVY